MPLLLHQGPRPIDPSVLDISNYLLEAQDERGLEDHLIVLPSGRLLRKLERQVTDRHHDLTGRPLLGLPLMTMHGLLGGLYDQIAPGRRDATMEIQIALMERAMRNVDLNYFGGPRGNPSLGVVEQVTRVITGVRADGILPSDFRTDLELIEEGDPKAERYDAAKLQDLYNIYSEYLRILGDTWVDYPGRMIRVNTALFENRDQLFRAAYPDVRTLVIYNHTEFTWPEIDMLIQLGMVQDLSTWIIFDYEEGNGPLYGNFEEVIGRLRVGRYAESPLDPVDPAVPEEERQPFTHHMRRNLFRTDERIENASFDERISVQSYLTRQEEVRGIAGLVKNLIVNEGVQPERICIATLEMHRYTDLFREFLPSYGIPAVITARYPLEQNGLVTALFSALNIIASNYDRRDLLRAVTSPYLDFGPEVDGAALADVSNKLRITRGYQSWRRRIGKRLDFVGERLRRTVDPDERRTLEIEIRTLQRAERSIEHLHEMLSDFRLRLSPTEFREAFLRLISRLGLLGNVLRLRHTLNAHPRTPADWQRIHDEMERDTRALERFLALLDELTELFELDAAQEGADEQGSTAEAEGNGRSESTPGELPDELDPDEEYVRSLGYYLDHVRTAAARSFYGIREKHDYGLLVTHLDQVQGLDFDVVIMCGLIDGEFPSTYIPANFLGKPLEKTQERQLRRERVAFYTGVTAWRERLVLTWPRNENGAELVRSSFLDALLRITTVERSGRIVEYGDLREERELRRASGEFIPERDHPAMIGSIGELAEEAGRVLWEGGLPGGFEEGQEMIDHLHHTATVEIGRHNASANPELVPEYRGIITEALSPEERAELGERREREYSASQLETYAKCPFKYFARRLLNVDAPPTFDVSLTPLERGVLVHAVLFRLYTELREQEKLPITAERRDEVIARAQEMTREEIEGISLDHPYWKIDRERLLGSETLNGLIEGWVDSEIDRSAGATRLVPEFFEVGFGSGVTARQGTDSLLSRDEEVEIYSVKVRGKVDRVEIVREGDILYYAVADYKTGQPPARQEVEQGLSLQLLLYLEVIRHILADYFSLPLKNVRPAGGIYYRLNARHVETKDTYLFVPNELKGDIISARKSSRDPQTVEDLEERMREAFAWAEQYVEGISSGIFHVTTHDVTKICRGCEFHSTCRVWGMG